MKLRIAVDNEGRIANLLRSVAEERALKGDHHAPAVRLRISAEAVIERAEIVRAVERLNAERLIDRRKEMMDDFVGPLPLLSGWILVLDLNLNGRQAKVEIREALNVSR